MPPGPPGPSPSAPKQAASVPLVLAAIVVGGLVAAVTFLANLNDRTLGVSDPAYASGTAIAPLLISCFIAFVAYRVAKPQRPNVFLIAFTIAVVVVGFASLVGNAA